MSWPGVLSVLIVLLISDWLVVFRIQNLQIFWPQICFSKGCKIKFVFLFIFVLKNILILTLLNL